jgi:transcriptional regulator with XRE-family HTH domain
MRQSELRETLISRLQFLTEEVGSVKAMADIIGVNRTQMTRYLNGTSVPRAELLAQMGHKLGIPLDWFFGDGEAERDLAELKLGMAFKKAVAHRNFEIPGIDAKREFVGIL